MAPTPRPYPHRRCTALRDFRFLIVSAKFSAGARDQNANLFRSENAVHCMSTKSVTLNLLSYRVRNVADVLTLEVPIVRKRCIAYGSTDSKI